MDYFVPHTRSGAVVFWTGIRVVLWLLLVLDRGVVVRTLTSDVRLEGLLARGALVDDRSRCVSNGWLGVHSCVGSVATSPLCCVGDLCARTAPQTRRGPRAKGHRVVWFLDGLCAAHAPNAAAQFRDVAPCDRLCVLAAQGL